MGSLAQISPLIDLLVDVVLRELREDKSAEANKEQGNERNQRVGIGEKDQSSATS